MPKEADNNETIEKKRKPNPCPVCFGLFENIDSIVQQIKEDEKLKAYEIDKFITSYSLPVLLELTQLQMWLAMIEKFPDDVSKGLSPQLLIEKHSVTVT